MPQTGGNSLYSKGLWDWNPNLSWGNNITNRGAVNLQDFLNLDPSKLYGQDTGYLTELLKNRIGGGLDPALVQAQAQGRQNISRQGDTARRKTREGLASSGFRGSGANLINDIFGTEANALGNQSADFGLMGMQQREQAISNLLGLNSMKTGVNTGITGQQVGVAGQLAGMGNQQSQLDAEERMSQFGWGDFFGTIASSLPYAALAFSDKRLKENIKKTGEKTRDGIPIVEFNYKGNTRRYRGVLAQDVEKEKPSAVFKAVDYSKI